MKLNDLIERANDLQKQGHGELDVICVFEGCIIEVDEVVKKDDITYFSDEPRGPVIFIDGI